MNFQRDFSVFVGFVLTAVCVFGCGLILTFNVRATDPNARMDFDGDGKTDIAVFRAGQRNVYPFPPSYFYVLSSGSGQLISRQWGRAYDIHTPADYDGDGKIDVAVFRWLADDLTPSLNHFWINYTTTGGHTAIDLSGFGNIVSRNYFGDQKAEIAVFDRHDVSEDPTAPCFIWAFHIKPEGSDFALRKDIINECLPNQQYITPAVADFNGDGITDLATFTQRNGAPAQSLFKLWFSPAAPQYTPPVFSMTFDIDYPIPGDYDGDSRADIAGSKNVGGTRLWRIRRSMNGEIVEKYFGFQSDYPVPGDYDGDNKTDLAVWRPSNGTWYISRSTDGALLSIAFGLPTDVPLTLPNSNIYY